MPTFLGREVRNDTTTNAHTTTSTTSTTSTTTTTNNTNSNENKSNNNNNNAKDPAATGQGGEDRPRNLLRGPRAPGRLRLTPSPPTKSFPIKSP